MYKFLSPLIVLVPHEQDLNLTLYAQVCWLCWLCCVLYMPLFGLVQFRFDLCLTNPRVTGSFGQRHRWNPGDEINKFMQVSSKTSMSNAFFHNLESGSNELQSGFSENQLKLIEKADTQRYPSSETQGQLVGTGKSLKRAKKNSGEEKSDFSSPEFFFARFRLFPVPTNCPWVSEDERYLAKCRISEPHCVQHAPRILRLFIRPPANFRQSFASRVLKNRDFFWYSNLQSGPIGHVRYINIQAWLRGFRVKIANF